MRGAVGAAGGRADARAGAQRSAALRCAHQCRTQAPPPPAARRCRAPAAARRRRAPPPPPRALDAAMPFDYEARARQQLAAEGRLRIGIVGFGTFGQFLARRLVAAGHEVLATSRTRHDAAAAAVGARFFADADDFCEEHPDVVVLACSILSLDAVLKSLPVARLRRSTLFVDVLSVKEFPKRLLLSRLPPTADVLCTHPMFGPDSGAGSWKGLNFMYERVRVGASARRQARAAAFLAFFEREGCAMVEMACEEHDRLAASSQFITHTVGRTLGAMGLAPSPIDTRGTQSLLALVDNTAHDSFDLYYGLFMYNRASTAELERLERAFDAVKRQLFDALHDRLRGQVFPDDDGAYAAAGGGGALPEPGGGAPEDSDEEGGAAGNGAGAGLNGAGAAAAGQRQQPAT